MEGKILLVDKPAGMTSHDVVDRVRRIFKTRRVGHAGTLDPFATGLLILGIESATKELSKYVGLDKTYVATARLGATSTTEDPEGEITERTAYDVPRTEDIETALDRFRGGYLQTASAFSAKKVGGKKLYELARRGKLEGVEIPKKQVTISELKVLKFEWPLLTFEVSCSSGTYVRALARDIGEALGCGAYLTELRRTRIGEFGIGDARKLEEISDAS
ncbi:tRNA pseudouridine(55) synthase TruB [Candidatus Uhrbacteria bacterium]|nr:tRNA pseudouridine(55) synthase TruB [Candidatus Uhrbacteria bacterium]